MTPPATPKRPTPRWVPIAVVVSALLVVGLAAQGTGLQWGEAEPADSGTEAATYSDETESSAAEAATETDDGAASEGSSLPQWVTWLLLAVFVGIPAGLILMLLARRLLDWLVHAPPSDGVPEPEPAHLRRDFSLVEDAIAAAIAEMDLGDDPRSAIMACWVHFERAAEAVGTVKDASDTPADLVRKLLTDHELDGAALSRLTGAYLRARYSPHEVGEADRDAARDALVALRTQLGLKEAR